MSVGMAGFLTETEGYFLFSGDDKGNFINGGKCA